MASAIRSIVARETLRKLQIALPDVTSLRLTAWASNAYAYSQDYEEVRAPAPRVPVDFSKIDALTDEEIGPFVDDLVSCIVRDKETLWKPLT